MSTMYRINLYPDYQHNRRLARFRALTMGVLAILLGFEILLVGVLIVSDHLLSERVALLRDDMPVLSARVQSLTHPRPDLDLARELIAHRSGRIDWSPKLAAISEHCGASLQFREVEGRARTQHEQPLLRIRGEAKKYINSLEAVTDFMQRLRRDERLHAEFDDIGLGNIRDGESGEFEVSCEQTEATP
jgi:hypothetical protein